MAIVFALVTLAFAAMVWEKLPTDIVALLALGALLLTGVLAPKEAFMVFSNEAAITVACMFVLSAALERTGAIDLIGRKLNVLGGRADWQVLMLTLPVVVFASAFVNNTPIVVVFMPIMISLAANRDFKPSKLLIPLSYASMFGGACTLIGTSTNILVSSTAEKMGEPAISMFELTPLGVLLALVGLVYVLTIGRKLLPDRDTLGSLLQSTESRQYLTEVVIVDGSPLLGKKIADTALKSLPGSRILDITRGTTTLDTPLNEIVLEQGDRLRLTTVLSSVMEIKGLKGVELLPHTDLGLEAIATEKAAFAECVIGPDSELIGKSLGQINFRQRYGVLILAVHRQGENLRANLGNVRLRLGDTLLLEGTESAIRRLQEDRNFLMLVDVPHAPPKRHRIGLVCAVIAAVVTLAAFNVMPIAVLALLGALTVVVTRCLDAEEAYKSVQWKVLFLIFGMLSLGMALEKTKGAELVANGLIHSLHWVGPEWRPLAALAAVYLFTNVLTAFLSNNAVAVLVTPIVIGAAEGLDVNARPFIIAVAIAASADFATPIGYQTNTLVYGAGGYKFRDFIKVGLPLNLLFWLLCVLLIPMFWPLR
jgi:di/tricarboxylate transporter